MWRQGWEECPEARSILSKAKWWEWASLIYVNSSHTFHKLAWLSGALHTPQVFAYIPGTFAYILFVCTRVKLIFYIPFIIFYLINVFYLYSDSLQKGWEAANIYHFISYSSQHCIELSFSSFCRWRNWGLKRFSSHLLQVPQSWNWNPKLSGTKLDLWQLRYASFSLCFFLFLQFFPSCCAWNRN